MFSSVNVCFFLTLHIFCTVIPISNGNKVPQRRIINGTETNSPELVEYMVALLVSPEDYVPVYYFTCGGVLIQPKYVLTAAHCVEGGNKKVKYVGYRNKGQSLELRTSWKHTTKSGIVAYIAHRRYVYERPDLNLFYYDVAIIILEVEIDVATADLPIINTAPLSTFFKKDLVIYGWGRTAKKAGTISEKLREMTGHIYDQAYEVDVPSYCNPPLTKVFCYYGVQQYQGGAIHNGDSGGPVVFQKKRPDNTIETTLVGIVRGTSRRLYLGGRNLRIMTNVAYFTEWIDLVLTPGKFPTKRQPANKFETCCKEYYD